MNKFHLIMPMGGNGSRFSKCGFNLPKPLIPIYGKPFIYWSTMSILKFNEVIDLTFVVLKDHVKKYNIDQEIKKLFPKAIIVIIDCVLNGPVLTCLEGVKGIKDDYPILFNDCDHLFKCTEFNKLSYTKNKDLAGALLTFKSNNPQYSYVVYNNGKVAGTIEKKATSNDAICGAYYFRSAAYFRLLSDRYLNNCKYDELYISGLYNEIANRGEEIKILNCDYHVPFGIPKEYEVALTDRHYIELE